MKVLANVTQMGLDCHRNFSRVSGRDGSGRIVWRERIEHRDRTALREQLRRWPTGIPVVLEGTFGWGWMADELQAAQLSPRLANSRKLAVWRKSRGLAKSNRLDADLLSELPSERENWWEVWLAPPVVRQQREWMRYRMTLVSMQTALKNRVHAVLHRHGIMHEFSDIFGAAGRRFLGNLATRPNTTCAGTSPCALPESARVMLKGYLQLLDSLRRQIARITAELRHQVRRTPEAQRLRTIPGIGWILAYTIQAEIGPIHRFRNARRLASYSLLAPMADDSGDEDPGRIPQGRHVGFVGRRTLKWAWIEAARSAVRHQRFKDLFDRRTNGGKRDRNRGYITVAHELCRVAYVLLRKEIDFTDQPPPRPGSQKRTSRSGTGQLDVAMVIAAT
jgi:transposase